MQVATPGEGQMFKTRSSSSLDELKKSVRALDCGSSLTVIHESSVLQEDDSDSEIDAEAELRRFCRSRSGRNDDQVVTKAKEMGKELFADLPPSKRKEKLDAMVRIHEHSVSDSLSH